MIIIRLLIIGPLGNAYAEGSHPVLIIETFEPGITERLPMLHPLNGLLGRDDAVIIDVKVIITVGALIVVQRQTIHPVPRAELRQRQIVESGDVPIFILIAEIILDDGFHGVFAHGIELADE